MVVTRNARRVSLGALYALHPLLMLPLFSQNLKSF